MRSSDGRWAIALAALVTMGAACGAGHAAGGPLALRSTPVARSAEDLAVAFDLQRGGKSQEACSRYARYLRQRPEEHAIRALRAHCLLDTGHMRAAIDAWKAADDVRNRGAIDKAIGKVFGPEHPATTRAAMIGRLGTPPTGDSLGALIRHDLAWRIDWWRADPRPALAREDLARFGAALPAEVRAGLALLIEIVEAPDASPDLARRLAVLLHDDAVRLPTAVLGGLVDHGVRRELISARDAFDRLRSVLERRALAPGGTEADLDLLAAIATGHDDRLVAEADRVCWERFRGQRCAEDHLTRARRAKTLKPDDPALRLALALHPRSTELRIIALALDARDKEDALWSIELLRQLILADFHALSTGDPAFGPTSNGIDNMFGVLDWAQTELEKAGLPGGTRDRSRGDQRSTGETPQQRRDRNHSDQ